MSDHHEAMKRTRSAMLEAMLTRRRFSRLAAGGAALIGAMPALGEAAPGLIAARAQEAGSGGQIVLGRSGDADTLDPHHTIAAIASGVFTNIYEPLVGRNMNLEYEGILAERWEISPDGKEYTFFLRPGIVFHDGTEFNAEAVKFTFDRLMEPKTEAPAASWISPLERTDVIDPTTVRMFLKEPFAPFLGNMSAGGYFGILSPKAVQDGGEEYGRNPIGTGPFRFKEWVSGERITLERNPEHQSFRSYVETDGPPRLDGLVFRNIPEEQTQVAAFETGEISLLVVPPRQVADFEGNPDYQLFRNEGGTGISFLEFSMLPPEGGNNARFKPPFDNLQVRQAVAYAVNADEIIERVLQGLAVRNYGPLPAGLYGANSEIEQFGYHHDLAEAARLLDEAGWTGDGVRQKDGEPLRIVFWTWSDTTQERVAQVIQNQLTQVGFEVQLETMEVATLLGRLGTDDDPSHLDLMGWSWSEPDILFMMTDTTSGIGYYRQEAYRTLVNQARVASDLEERARLYFEAMKVMLTDAAMVPLWTEQEVVGVRSEVKDFKLGPLGSYVYHDAYVEEG